MMATISEQTKSGGLRVPVLDLEPLFQSDPDGEKRLAEQLKAALEDVGFFFIINHHVPAELIATVFGEAKRFHDQDMNVKSKLKMNAAHAGYMQMGSGRAANYEAEGEDENYNTADQNEGYNVIRDLSPDDPRILAKKPLFGTNLWPDNLPGFRENTLEYFSAIEDLTRRLLPIFALSLDLPRDYFEYFFEEPYAALKLAHYPPVKYQENQFGIAAHTDSSFITFLPQNELPGLEIQPEGHGWMEPPALPGSILINSGDILKRWTNDRFRSTLHRAVNRSGRSRYAIPVFVAPTTDVTLSCLPTCQLKDSGAKYPPITYEQYLVQAIEDNYYKNPLQEPAG